MKEAARGRGEGRLLERASAAGGGVAGEVGESADRKPPRKQQTPQGLEKLSGVKSRLNHTKALVDKNLEKVKSENR